MSLDNNGLNREPTSDAKGWWKQASSTRKVLIIGFGALVLLYLVEIFVNGADSPGSGETSSVSRTTTTTTVARPSWSAFTVSGRGDDVIDFSIPGDDVAALRIRHSGTRNFSVVTYTAGGRRLDLLVNTIGSYGGVVPVNLYNGEEVGEIEITADGSWSIEAMPVTSLPRFGGAATGSGDTVLVNASGAGRLDISHSGDRNFIVLSHGSRRELLVNDIGPYSGTVRVDSGSVLIEIRADGSWSIRSAG
jgi:hypothetical protein